MIMKYRHSREESTIQTIAFTFQIFTMKNSLVFASTTPGEYEN